MSRTSSVPTQAYPRGGDFPRSRSPVVPDSEDERREHAERLAGFLGWFSIGLGVTSLAAPRALARFIGARGDDTDKTIFQVVGLQELACGIGILMTRRPAGWVWARVAGDMAHLSMITGAMASGPPEPERMAAAAAALVGITAVDAYDALQLSRGPRQGVASWGFGPVEVYQTITINRPAEELYRFWRDFENLPRIMSHLESVRAEGDGRSHWKAKGPAGTSVEWDAEITEDRPNERIAWRSVGGPVDNSGTIRFVPAPGGRGTEVHVQMRYSPPGGVVGALAAKLTVVAPEQQVYDELRHFKQVMETGEVVRSASSGDGSRIVQRPAQPLPATSDR